MLSLVALLMLMVMQRRLLLLPLLVVVMVGRRGQVVRMMGFGQMLLRCLCAHRVCRVNGACEKRLRPLSDVWLSVSWVHRVGWRERVGPVCRGLGRWWGVRW